MEGQRVHHPMLTDTTLTQFTTWLEEASAHPGIADATAMFLATATPQGVPSGRVVLLKGYDTRGFVFYTNEASRKGNELAENARAALTFWWEPLGRQVRIEGTVESVSTEEADAYFESRHRESQIGAWVSQQSQPLENREALEKAFAAKQEECSDAPVPRPPYWTGYRVTPDLVEFWQRGDHRLHHREIWRQEGDHWNNTLLYP